MKTQHERIEYVSTTEVVITKSDGTRAKLTIWDGGLEFQPSAWFDGIWLDPESEALALCIACFRQTGSFEALLTCNAIPFVGKLARDPFGRELVVTEFDNKQLGVLKKDTDGHRFHKWVVVEDIRPLDPLQPPQPKYRAYTAAEAAKHLGRSIRVGDSTLMILWNVELAGVLLKELGIGRSKFIGFNALVNESWADTGEPVGVKIEGDCATETRAALRKKKFAPG